MSTTSNQPSLGRVGYQVPARLYELPRSDRNRIVNAHRGRTVSDLDRDDDVHIARSLRVSLARINGALAVACTEHDAAPGAYCFGAPGSGVRAFCGARYACGVRAEALRKTHRPEELADLAQAARNAHRDSRIREHNAARSGQGSSIRMHVAREVDR